MKKITFKITSICLCLALCLFAIPKISAFASGEKTSGIYTYSITVDGNASIIKCDTRGRDSIVIPNTLGGAAVSFIGNEAFKGSQNLKSITIPSSLITVGESAFENCVNLENVEFADYSQLLFINPKAFQNCTSLKTIDFGESSQLTFITPNAFKNCSSLETITLPKNVLYVDIGAFEGCESLKTVYFSCNRQRLSIGENNDMLKNAEWVSLNGDSSQNIGNSSFDSSSEDPSDATPPPDDSNESIWKLLIAGSLVWILVIIGALVVLTGFVITILIIKKKKQK